MTYNERKAAGLCITCNNTVNGSVYCVICKQKQADKRKYNKANGLCQCGKIKSKGHLCDKCKIRRKVYSVKRYKSGICVSCVQPIVSIKSSYCKNHSLKAIARNNLGDASMSIFLLGLLNKQDNKCCYCGIGIFLNDNAAVDHIKPKSRFPELKSDPSNIQWLCEDCNIKKNKYTELELLAWAHQLIKKLSK